MSKGKNNFARITPPPLPQERRRHDNNTVGYEERDVSEIQRRATEVAERRKRVGEYFRHNGFVTASLREVIILKGLRTDLYRDLMHITTSLSEVLRSAIQKKMSVIVVC